MTDNQKRKLNAWLAVNVMGWIPVKGDYWRGAVNPGKFNCKIEEADAWAFEYPGGVGVFQNSKQYCSTNAYEWNPTSESEDAATIFKKLVEKFKTSICTCWRTDGTQIYFGGSAYITSQVTAETWELAVAQFAKKNWNK